MVISLYTSRIVLQTLGVQDFGIYNVVGGVVAMFSVLSGSLSSAISRYLTYNLGKADLEKLKKTFSCSVTVQVFLAIIIFVLAEIAGVWFLNEKMVIPDDRLVAANWVLQCSILTFMVNLISVPYNASIIAHEKMSIFAYISILEVILKLLVVFSLYISPFDKLKSYAILLLMVAILIRMTYSIYCKKHFEECTYHFTYDKSLLKEMFGFAGWNFIGSSSVVLRDQGDNIVINLLCGPAVNAARGIAFQVNSAINHFVTNFQTAFNPAITKSYASGEKDYMMSLIFRASRFSVYLLLLLSIPIIIETKTVLHLWLNIVPDHTILFIRLVLFFSISDAISKPLITAILATGRIKKYQIIVGGIQITNLPLSYIFLKIGFIPETTLIIAIILSQLCLLARMILLRTMIDLDSVRFIKTVYLNVILVGILSFISPLLLAHLMPSGIARFIIVTLISIIWTSMIILIVGCSRNERNSLFLKLKEIKAKL